MEVRWQRTTRRGAVLGAVIAAHAALFLWLIAPPIARPVVRRRRTSQVLNVMQVELLEPSRTEPAPATRPRRPVRTVSHMTHVPTSASHRTRRTTTPVVTLLATPTADSSVAPTYIAGGDFDRRLRDSHLAPRPPKLPGGQRYLAANLHFVPEWQDSIAGKVHALSLMLTGGFDPVCKDAHLELSRSRLRQIADGYTPGDLRRLLREHHCN